MSIGDCERSQSPTSDCDRERLQSLVAIASAHNRPWAIAIAYGRLQALAIAHERLQSLTVAHGRRLAIVKESVHVSFCARFSGFLFSFGFTFCTFILAVKLLSCARQALVVRARMTQIQENIRDSESEAFGLALSLTQ